LNCGVKFLTNEIDVDNYFAGLMDTISASAEKHDIGKVPVHFNYKYPIGWEQSCISATNTGHETTCMRPLTGNTAITVITKNSDNTCDIVRSSSRCYVTFDDKTGLVSNGHGRDVGQIIEQSRMTSAQTVKTDRNDDKIGTFDTSINCDNAK
jgi:hypothetical protein